MIEAFKGTYEQSQDFSLLSDAFVKEFDMKIDSDNGLVQHSQDGIIYTFRAEKSVIFKAWEQRRDLLVSMLDNIDLYVSMMPYLNYKYAYAPKDGVSLSTEYLYFIYSEINDFEVFRKQSCIICLKKSRAMYDEKNVLLRNYRNNVYPMCDECAKSMRQIYNVDESKRNVAAGTNTWLDNF